MTRAALAAVAQLDRAQERAVSLKLGSPDDFLLRALRQAITLERIRLEQGLTLLASVGSAAPFIGLFGTVWGIYHALLAIGSAGQSSLDKVAGPVGEALIMTGFGLAVALPAVLIYNFFVRRNRLKLAALDEFAYDLFALLVTGFEQASPKVTQLAEREARKGRG
ncbi:Biopolymer transport protein ExbB [compost metagenome]